MIKSCVDEWKFNDLVDWENKRTAKEHKGNIFFVERQDKENIEKREKEYKGIKK